MMRRHARESLASGLVGRPPVSARPTLDSPAQEGYEEREVGNGKSAGPTLLPPSTSVSLPRRGWAWLPVLSLVAALGCAAAGTTARRFDTSALINPRLSPRYAQYLVGPLARVASDAELDAFLALADDAAAEDFLERFWAARDPNPQRPGNPFRDLYEQRAAEADKRFSQAAYLGRRTDRGTIWILHGPPDETDFEPNPTGYGELVEVWRYSGETARVNLNQRLPDAIYRFLQREDLKVFYTPPLGYVPVDRR